MHAPNPIAAFSFASIPSKSLDWLWFPFIPRGRITLLAGDPGSGKTSLALHLAAQLSRGIPLPFRSSSLSDGLTLSRTAGTPSAHAATQPLEPPEPPIENRKSKIENNPFPQSTLLLSPDDNPADTLRPRLEQLHADLEHVHTLANFPSLLPPPDFNPNHPAALTPLERLDELLNAIPNLALLIIDPITYFLGLADRAQPLTATNPSFLHRSTLSRLTQLAERHNIAILLTTRLTKKIPDLTPGASLLPPSNLHRTLGSLAFATTARSVLLLSQLPSPSTHLTPGDTPGACETHTPEQAAHSPQPLDRNESPAITSLDPTPTENRKSKIENPPPTPTHLLLSLKSNLTRPPAPLPFTLAESITWHPHVSLPDLFPPPPAPPPKSPGPPDLITQAAADWLLLALASGPVLATSVTSAARDNAIPIATLNRAKALAAVESVRQDWSGKWFWKLKSDNRPLPESYIDRCIARMARLDNHAENPRIAGSELDNLAEKTHRARKKPDNLPEKSHRSPSVSEGSTLPPPSGTLPAHAAPQPPEPPEPQSKIEIRNSKIPPPSL
ncbi:MAG: AAA family ATPase [Phycisphaerae bacterium]